MKTKLLTIPLLFLLLLSFKASAQVTTFTREPFSSMISNDDLAKLERQFEIPIRNALGDYFQKESFLIDVKINLKEVLVPTDFNREFSSEEVAGIDAMPGLPFVPDELSSKVLTKDSLRATKFKKVHEIGTITVNVVLDESYGQNDIDFVSALIRSVGKLNQFRGDQIIIESRKFPDPKKKELSLDELQAENFEKSRPLPVDEEGNPINRSEQKSTSTNDSQSRISRIDSVIISKTNRVEGAQTDPMLEWFKSPVMLVLLGFLFVNLLLLVYMIATRNQFKKIEIPEVDLSPVTAAIAELKQVQTTALEKTEKQEEEKPSPESRSRFEADKSYLTIQSITNTAVVAEVLVDMIESDHETGAVRAANSISSINSGLLTTLKPALGEEYTLIIEHTLEDLPALTESNRFKFARAFASQVKAHAGPISSGQNHSDVFHFLDQLNNSQLNLLLKNEELDMVAIIIAQLNAQRANDLLKSYSEDEQLAILVKMGKINSLPVSTYKQIATHFSQKALEIVNMKHVVADGVQRVIDVIDELPAEEQDHYLDKIAFSDLELAQKVRSVFVTFNDIPNLDESLIIKSLQGIDRNVVVHALYGASSEIVSKVMAIYASRERLIVQSQLDGLRDPEPEEIDSARREILYAIRANKRSKKGA